VYNIGTVTIHSYNIVKDHCTNYETSDTEGYLNGHVDPFIFADLRIKASDVAVEA
jgi:peptide chain release factor 2